VVSGNRPPRPAARGCDAKILPVGEFQRFRGFCECGNYANRRNCGILRTGWFCRCLFRVDCGI